MGPWGIALLGLLAFAALVAGVQLYRTRYHRRSGHRATLEVTPDVLWGTLPRVPVSGRPPWGELPEWARPEYPRESGQGWISGAEGGPGRGWTWDDPWEPEPVRPAPHPSAVWGPLSGLALQGADEEFTRLADTGDVMNARLAADVAAECHRQDADVEAWLALRTGQWAELAVTR